MTQNRSSAVMQQRSEPLEQWRSIEGWPGYEVSDHGRVRSWKQRTKGRLWLPDYSQPARILRPDVRNGYASVVLSEKGKPVMRASVHRLVVEAFEGPSPDGWHGAHGNGDKSDNRLVNLRWASPAENNADKRAHGTYQSGEKIGAARLTSVQVLEIRARRASGETVRAVADRFGVCRNTVTNITRGHSWRAVQ